MHALYDKLYVPANALSIENALRLLFAELNVKSLLFKALPLEKVRLSIKRLLLHEPP